MQKKIFLGDSLVQWGDWDRLLPAHHIVNRGLTGESTGELATRLFDELEEVSGVDTIFIVSGTNNYLMGDYFFPEIFKSMLPRISLLVPEAKVVVNSLFPYRLPGVDITRLRAINLKLAETVRSAGFVFLDVLTSFSNEDVLYFSPDGVHLSDKGYLQWAEEIEESLN